MGTSQANDESPIQPSRIRVPRENNTALHRPPLDKASDLLRANRAIIADQAETRLPVSFLNWKSNERRLSFLQTQARSEFLSLAYQYSSSYLDANPKAIIQNTNTPIIMSGHQPELFHPGVWYKNFVLSALAEELNGVAINLVVDSDLAKQNSIRFPDVQASPPRAGTIPITNTRHAVPFELQSIGDLTFFSKFPSRVHEACSTAGIPQNRTPIIDKLWPEVIAAVNAFSAIHSKPQLGVSIAAGRHRLEQNIGLNTLEVPVSQVSTLKPFAIFTAAIFDAPERFLESYNSAIDAYRVVHRIRSHSHPVPKLVKADGWIEVPFWIYAPNSTTRERLFIKKSTSHVLLTDLNGREFKIATSSFIDEFSAFSSQQIFIRPRALMTTMFSRLFLSDVFLHGIGGAKYDQLTDEIAKQFFDYRLPCYMTLSATMRLPTDEPTLSKTDVTKLRQLKRELVFHPENYIPKSNRSPQVKELIQLKSQLTSPSLQNLRGKELHQKIESVNRQLQSHTNDSVESIQQKIAAAKSQLRTSEIAGSREYSFCLFDEDLFLNLQALATK